MLAHHWALAGDQMQQARFALQAGEHALRRAAFGDAINLFHNALAALPEKESQFSFQAMLGVVQALEATSNVPELAKAVTTLRKLAKRTGKLVNQAEAAQHQANFALLQGELDKVDAIVRRGLAWANSAQAVSLQANLLQTLGKTHRDQGNYDQAYTQAEQALALYQSDGNKPGQIAILNLLGNLNVHQGQHRQAVQVHRQALDLCRQLIDPFSESRILAWLADALWYLGNYDEVQQVIEEGLAVSREIGDKVGEAVQLNNLAGLAITQHDSHTAITYYRQALAIAETMNDPRRTAVYYNNIGGAYVGLGDTSAALLYLEKAIAVAREAGLPRQEAHAHHTLGCAYQEANNLVLARAAFEQALSLRQKLGEQFRLFLTLTQLVETCVGLGDRQAAETYLLAARQRYDSLRDDMPQYAHQQFHYVAYLFYKAQSAISAAAKHLAQAHQALQNQLAELDSAAQAQLCQSSQAEVILTAMAQPGQ